MGAETIALYIVKSENGHIRDIGIIIESSIVLNHLEDISRGCYLLGLTYVLDLKYHKTLKYSFEVFQKMLVISQQKCKD